MKNSSFQTLYWIGKNLDVRPRLSKNPNLPLLLWIGKNLEVYTAQEQHLKIQILNLWMNWEKLCPNLNFAVENKMMNLHKNDGHILNLT